MLRNTSVRTTALLTALLCLAGAAQAHGFEPGDPLEASMKLLDGLQDDGAGEDGDETGLLVEQTQDRAEATIEDAQRMADREALFATLGQALTPIHDSLDSVQAEAGKILYGEPEETQAAPSEEPAPVATASTAEFPVLENPILLIASAAIGMGFLLWFAGQSATIGAGAAGTALNGRKFIPFASPLFTRFEKDTVLGHPKREAIYGSIISQPGVTLQDLCEETGLSRTAVTHHLRLMEQQHLIVSKRVGRSRHFFENGGRYGRHQKDAYAVLHNERTKEIHDHIQAHPGAIQKDICGAFEIQPSVAHWHLKRLTEANLVDSMRQGRTVSYFPADALVPSEASRAAAPAAHAAVA